MKRKRLLFAAIALIAGALNINAQGWTASEVADGDYYLYNVGADAYLYHGSNWNTHGVVRKNEGFIVTVSKVEESIITISTNSYYPGKYFTDNGYVDTGSPTNWTFEEVDADKHIFKLSSNGNYAFVEKDKLGDLGIGEDTGDDYSKWQLVTRDARIAAFENATEENPVDASFLLTNPNFSEGTKGWTSEGKNADVNGYRGDEDVAGNGSGNYKRNYCCEVFNGNFNFYQKAKGAPAGKYRLSFQGYYRYGGHGVGPAVTAREAGTELLNTTLFANNESAPLMSILDESYNPAPSSGGWSEASFASGDSYFVPNNMDAASVAFNDGKYTATMDFSVTSGDLTIGVKKETTVTNDWTIFDCAVLTYLGPLEDFSEFETDLALKVEAANAISPLPTNAKTYLDEVINTYNKTWTSVDEYLSAIQAIETATEEASALSAVYVEALETYPIPTAAAQALATAVTNADNGEYIVVDNLIANTAWLRSAVDDAKAWIEPYAAFNLAKTDVQALYDVAEYEELVEGAHDALGDALAAGAAGDEAETVDQLNLATDNLKAAGYTYVCNANPTGDAKFDLTFMLTNPDVTEYWDGSTWWIQPEGWYNEQDGGNFQVMANEDMGPGGEIFMEYWSEIAASNGFVLCQKVTLPVGAYQMAGRVGVQQYDGKGTTTNVTFSANEVDGTQIPFGGLTDGSIEFINNAEQEVRIGLKAHEGNNARWMAINKIHLYKIAPKAFIINENEDYDYTQSGAGDVKLTRTIKEGMNSVVLPFQLTAEDIVTLGGEGAVAYTVTDYANDNLKLAEATTILANTPFFLKVVNLQNTNLFEFTDKTIVAGEPVVPVGDATLVGTYAKIDAVPAGSYILSGGKFYLVNSTVSLKPTRAYITIAEPTEVSALGFSFEDATAIVGVESETVNGEVYDIAGRKVSAPVRGLYIANGKKVLVK